jgi:hypothetical protein
MNLIGAVLVSLWALGWMIAAVRAGLKGRVANPARHYQTGNYMKSGGSGR